MSRSLTLAAALALLAALLLLLGPAACQRLRSLGAQARLGNAQLQAAGESGADAVATTAAAGARERESEQLSQRNREEIHHAQGADQSLHPDLRDAALRSLCRRAAYRDGERCRLLEPRPR